MKRKEGEKESERERAREREREKAPGPVLGTSPSGDQAELSQRAVRLFVCWTANGAAAATSGASAGTGVTSVTGEKKKAQEEAKRRMERIQAALTQLGSGDDMKEVRNKLNQEMSRAKKASEPQHLANDIEDMDVAGSPPAERAGGRHRQVAGAFDTIASSPSGDTAGKEHGVCWCW